jgi:hypothetical protein
MNSTISTPKLMKLFKEYSIERAIVFPNPNVGDKYPQMNDYIAESVKAYPDRLVGFGRVDPRRDDAMAELKRMKNRLHLTGLKLHPFVECFRPDHPFFNKFFKKANELDLPILFHTGDGFSSPGLIVKIAKEYPKLPIILGHLREGCVSALRECHNVNAETSGTLPDLIELATDVDEDRVLFGSDIPYYRYVTQIAIVEATNISQRAKRKVFYENFKRILPKTE